MADTPDISRVVAVIMEHPELLSQITALLGKEGEHTEEPAVEAVSEVHEDIPMPPEGPSARRRGRSDLLYAMKPYLSEKRAKAVDTIVTIADILDNMRGS